MSFYDEDERIVHFRFNPAEWRDYAGRWVEGGAAHTHPLPAIKDVLRIKSGDAVWSGAKAMQALGVTVDSAAANARRILALAPQKQREYDATWYYRANALADGLAKQYNVQTWRAVGVIAALSPQTQWSAKEDMSPRNSNQLIASRVMEIAFDPVESHRHVVLTQEMNEQMKEEAWQTYVAAKRKKKEEPDPSRRDDFINWSAYDGTDPHFQQGEDFTGEHALSDLPVDIVALLTQKYLGGLGANEEKALLIARGDDPADILGGGGKTRSFYNDILDPWHAEETTVDVHMARALTNDLGLKEAELANLTKTGERYRILDEALRQVGRENGLQGHQVQAIIWEEWRRLHSAAERASLTREETALQAASKYTKEKFD